MSGRETEVYVDLQGRPVLAGRLWPHIRRGREGASFAYDAAWLSREDGFDLEPAMPRSGMSFHTRRGKALFGAMADTAPDRWGRMLMRRTERKRAEQENREPRTLYETDYLLMVDDEARQGALRFKDAGGGGFLAAASGTRIPPFIELPRLLAASGRVEDMQETGEDLHLLAAPGSSMGGARPKAVVRDRDGALTLAKFPLKTDEISAVPWEGTALVLAERAGIDTPSWRIEQFAEKPVLLIRRFDRSASGARAPFISAMTMLQADDHEPKSYLDIADNLLQHGAAPREDLIQLWRRIVFNVLISNTDEHLRNHGFLHSAAGWRLSPVYDINPSPEFTGPREMSTFIDRGRPEASIELALATAGNYGLSQTEARAFAAEAGRAAASWREAAGNMNIPAPETDRMAPAFEHREAEKARRLETTRVPVSSGAPTDGRNPTTKGGKKRL